MLASGWDVAKGGDYEREVCKDISLWWSGGENQDVFWRSQNSGGRATTRMKAGGTLLGQEGDIAAVDPSGRALLQVTAIELKRGYNESHPWNTVDKGNHLQQQGWEGMVEQAQAAGRNSGAYAWMLIHRRDNRKPCVYIPHYFYKALRACGAFPSMPRPFWDFAVEIRPPKKREGTWERVWGTTLENFFAGCQPNHIREIANEFG